MKIELAGLVVGPGVRIDFTPAARSECNGQFGIFLQGAGGNVVEANTTSHNGVDGISLQRAVRACVNYDATDTWSSRTSPRATAATASSPTRSRSRTRSARRLSAVGTKSS
jgi:parallel beta-helix repeat protein